MDNYFQKIRISSGKTIISQNQFFWDEIELKTKLECLGEDSIGMC